MNSYFLREKIGKLETKNLLHFESVMLEKHQKEYRYITDEDFKNRIKELKSNIDNISDSEFVVEIQRIMSYFKEGHLSFLNPSQAILPFYLKTFDDGTYIIGIEKEYEEYNFSKVKSINGIKIKDIREKAKKIILNEVIPQIIAKLHNELDVPLHDVEEAAINGVVLTIQELIDTENNALAILKSKKQEKIDSYDNKVLNIQKDIELIKGI